VAWDAHFRVDSPDTDYYLLTEGHWQDRDCSNVDSDQFASWTFHVRTGSASWASLIEMDQLTSANSIFNVSTVSRAPKRSPRCFVL
jgi:hypothetical protein